MDVENERTYQLYAAEAARFNPELLPWIPVGNFRRAMSGRTGRGAHRW